MFYYVNKAIIIKKYPYSVLTKTVKRARLEFQQNAVLFRGLYRHIHPRLALLDLPAVQCKLKSHGHKLNIYIFLCHNDMSSGNLNCRHFMKVFCIGF